MKSQVSTEMYGPFETESLVLRISVDDSVSGNRLSFSVHLRDTGEHVGDVSLDPIDEANRSARIFFNTEPLHRGKSIAFDASKRLIEFAFDDININRVYGSCASDNSAGLRVLQKLGLKHEGTARAEILFDGNFRDVEHYAIIKSDAEREYRPNLMLETERLILRSPVFSDIGRVIGPINDPVISDNSAHIPYPFTEEEAKKWYSQICWAGSTWGHVILVITSKKTGELIGSCWLRPDKWHKKSGIAYWIGRKFWNKGYATEAVGRLARYAFEECGIERLTAAILVGNDSSVSVAKKLGMELECTAYKEWWNNDKPIDCRHYVLYKEKWEKQL